MSVLVWLLIAMSNGGASSYYYEARPAVVVERFATQAECERVLKWINENNRSGAVHGCIGATAIR